MKKILVALLVLALGMPLMADVAITASDAGSQYLLLSFTGPADAVRGIALTLTVTGGTITSAANYDTTVPSAFNTFVDYAATPGVTYTVGMTGQHPFAKETLSGEPTFPIAAGTPFAVSVGYLDQGGLQKGLTSGVIAKIKIDGIANGTNATVAISANATRGGAAVGDTLGVVTVQASQTVAGEPAGFTLTTASDAHCTVTVPGEGVYPLLTGPQTITAVADAGWHFFAWTGDVANIANVNAASTTIDMIADASITATTERDPETISTPTVTHTAASPAGTSGRINSGRTETFVASGAVSSYGDGLEYQFTWGDAVVGPWGAATQTHVYTYTAAVTRNVTVQARCATHTSVVSSASAAVVCTSEAVKSTATTIYAAWNTFGKPNCWAFQRGCRGDSNGVGTGLGAAKVWVNSADLAIFAAAYNKSQTLLLPVVVSGMPGICADTDRAGSGLGAAKVWVNSTDLTNFAASFNKAQSLVLVCAQTNYWYYTN